jgi:predicted alpha/beta-fold hydrolase
LSAAIAVSVPYDLFKVAYRVQRGFSRLYQWYLLKCVRNRLLKKPRYTSPRIDMRLLAAANTITAFDSTYTVPLHGFDSVDDYYRKTSSRQYLRTIRVPTLLLHAKDDPFMTEDVIPYPFELSENVQLEVTNAGGHVGFIAGNYPWSPRYWLEERVPEFLNQYW